MVKITKGDHAPFSGVLLSEPDFRYFKTKEASSDELDRYILNEKGDLIEPTTTGVLDYILPFVIGAVVGSVVTLELHR